ncbi:MAG: DUF4115 domain-containing protein [Phormidesmis sp. CAN_BIN36]|nr:DUF4115 domain-containing protein [Phormidesmis sp. CAN_BIN36]
MSVLRAVSAPHYSPQDFAKPGSQSETIVTPSPVVVSILMTDRAWVSITIDRKLEFEGVLSEGTRYTWAANQQIILQAGNAGALVVSSNRNSVQRFGKSGEIKEAIFSN